MKAQTPYRTVVSNLSQLSSDELDDVAAMIAGLLAARAAEEGTVAEESAQTTAGPTPSRRHRGPGWYEKKEVHGRYYKYLRYWSGTAHKSTYKSVYIGKWE